MNGALFPRIILVLTGASLFVMSRKSCLKFSYACSESESSKHSWKWQVLKSTKKSISIKSLMTSISDLSRSYSLVILSKGGHDKFVKVTNSSFDCFTMPEVVDWLE